MAALQFSFLEENRNTRDMPPVFSAKQKQQNYLLL
jgi:hypothetical protein